LNTKLSSLDYSL